MQVVLFFRDLVCSEELTGGIRAIDLEAFVCAREFLQETEVVECGGDKEKLRIEAELSLTALFSREEVEAHRMIEEQPRGMLAQEIGGFFRKQRIWNDESSS